MDFSSVNWLAVVACVVASMIIGAVWFGPKTFFPIWWKAIGKSDSEDSSGSTLSMGLTWGLILLSSFVQAVFMSLFVNAMGSLTGGATLASGATAGFLLWLGFVRRPPESLGARSRQSSHHIRCNGRDHRRLAEIRLGSLESKRDSFVRVPFSIL
jgi:Protein of unknown function (DUF1761)